MVLFPFLHLSILFKFPPNLIISFHLSPSLSSLSLPTLRKATGWSSTRSLRTSPIPSVFTSPVCLVPLFGTQSPVTSHTHPLSLPPSLADYEKTLQSGEGNSEELLAAKKKLVQLVAKINELGDSLSANKDPSMYGLPPPSSLLPPK